MNAAFAANTTYSGRVTNWPILCLLVGLAVPFLIFGSEGQSLQDLILPYAIVAAAVAATVLTTSSVRATAGANGVQVRFGPLGWPRFHYPSERISRAVVVDIAPWSMLGWGIYWSPGRGLLLTLRSGPALRLHLTNGRKVTVSMPDPAAACAALALTDD